ncbi:MAG: hypothetical protein AAGD32_10480 [Planctomycetota bacterium]
MRPTEIPGQMYPGFDGYVRIVTTDDPVAQAWFDQGIQLLYGFNHDEAIRSFQQAAALDPDCAMAHWGEAYARGLHINNPVMGREQSELAHVAAKRAVAALDDETPVEHALVHAVAQRYVLPVPDDRTHLDEAYAAAMQLVWEAHPDDPDVGPLYAESMMNLQPWDLWTPDGEPKGRTEEILAVLEQSMTNVPDHPGANHFYIHAIEASPWPEKGTTAAERLVDLVPGSGHLVHMPAHIFIRTGRYADAADANVRALAADDRYLDLAPQPTFYWVYYMHNAHFLAYAAMMEGRYETALVAARKIKRDVPIEFVEALPEVADGLTPVAYHVLLRFGKWEQVLAEPEPQDWRWSSRATRHYARAVALANLGRLDEAHAELAALDSVAEMFDDSWYVGVNQAADVFATARKTAEGEMAYHAGDPDRAFALLDEAVAMEEALAYDEPPGWMQPVRHALGALLLAEGKAERAEAVYRADLKRHPNNGWSLRGLHDALAMQGRGEDADAIKPKLAAAFVRADVEPIASCYCHPDAD